jgi:hypothetical protein
MGRSSIFHEAARKNSVSDLTSRATRRRANDGLRGISSDTRNPLFAVRPVRGRAGLTQSSAMIGQDRRRHLNAGLSSD